MKVMNNKPSRQPTGIPSGGQFAATERAESGVRITPVLGRADDAFEHAVEQIGLHPMAITHWREQGATLMQQHSRESWDASQLYFTAHRAVDRAACRIIDEAGMLHEAYDFNNNEDMGKYAELLEPALEMVSSGYKQSLSAVSRGGLFHATNMELARKALRYEIELAKATQ